MKNYLIIISMLGMFNEVKAQLFLDIDQRVSSFSRYTDFHIHPTYKHFFRYRTDFEIREILRGTSYDPNSDSFIFQPGLITKYRDTNWLKYEKFTKPKNLKALKNGRVSNLRNYDQSGYPQIMYVPGSILCNSYSPYEKQFALKGFKRFISSTVVTGMGLKRLKSYSEDLHCPFDEFRAEYYFNLLQRERKFIETQVPTHHYWQNGSSFTSNPSYWNIIKMVRDSNELDSLVKHNDRVFSSTWNVDSPPEIYTPMVMTVEGAQLLYGPESAKAKYILNPLNYDGRGKFFKKIPATKLAEIRKEILDNVIKVRNLPHRFFFITPAHFAQNHVVGFAKTLDRDPENFQHRFIKELTKAPSFRNDAIRKTYAGFNMGCDDSHRGCIVDSIGFRVIEKFLDPDPNISKYGKPTYIDVKHMDVKARIQYYYMRRKYEKKYNVSIPIIASHFGVSGENQALAAATGLRPYFDRYEETENPGAFYNGFIFRRDYIDKRKEYWEQEIMQKLKFDAFEKAMYRPLDFLSTGILESGNVYDPFIKNRKDPSTFGWYYPWSLNLFDEEIIEIDKSDGIIGLLLDPRQLGAFMPKYKDQVKDLKEPYHVLVKTLDPIELANYGLKQEDLNDEIEYFKTEPFIRNIFYIADIIKKQRAAEKYFVDSGNDYERTLALYPFFIRDTLFTEKEAWDLIAIGADFDGLIDPIDYAPTASDIPYLRRKMIPYTVIFAQLHSNEFKEPLSNERFVKTLKESNEIMEKIFYTNGRNFILKYF